MDTSPKQYGKTTDGVDIVEGLAVFTNEMQVGLVRLDRERTSDDGWFDVEYAPAADGHSRRVMQNGERVATTFRGLDGKRRVAADEWAQQAGDQ